MRRAALAATIALLAASLPGVARAADVSREQLAELAELTAQGDPAAEDQLRAVTSADGVPVEIESALDGATGDELRGRAAELADSARAAADDSLPDATAARDRALEIVDDGGESAVGTSEQGGLDLPSVPAFVAVLLAAIAVIVGALLARSIARRRVVEPRAPGPAAADDRVRPASLEREANEAERRGDYATAIRLRFRAGLERLDAAGALRLRPALTAPGAARELGSPRLAELAADYDEIVFGARAARSADARAAAAGWSEVLRGASA